MHYNQPDSPSVHGARVVARSVQSGMRSHAYGLQLAPRRDGVDSLLGLIEQAMDRNGRAGGFRARVGCRALACSDIGIVFWAPLGRIHAQMCVVIASAHWCWCKQVRCNRCGATGAVQTGVVQTGAVQAGAGECAERTSWIAGSHSDARSGDPTDGHEAPNVLPPIMCSRLASARNAPRSHLRRAAAPARGPRGEPQRTARARQRSPPTVSRGARTVPARWSARRP